MFLEEEAGFPATRLFILIHSKCKVFDFVCLSVAFLLPSGILHSFNSEALLPMKMHSILARAIVALLPAIARAQSTTYTLTLGDVVTSVVLPIPQAETTTITLREAQATLILTTRVPQPVATQTIIITAPVNQITSIAAAIPKSVQQVVSEEGNQIVPITIHDYVTSILIPASASIPAGVTLSPITPVILPVPTVVPSLASELLSAEHESLSASVERLSSALVSGKH